MSLRNYASCNQFCKCPEINGRAKPSGTILFSQILSRFILRNTHEVFSGRLLTCTHCSRPSHCSLDKNNFDLSHAEKNLDDGYLLKYIPTVDTVGISLFINSNMTLIIGCHQRIINCGPLASLFLKLDGLSLVCLKALHLEILSFNKYTTPLYS